MGSFTSAVPLFCEEIVRAADHLLLEAIGIAHFVALL